MTDRQPGRRRPAQRSRTVASGLAAAATVALAAGMALGSRQPATSLPRPGTVVQLPGGATGGRVVTPPPPPTTSGGS